MLGADQHLSDNSLLTLLIQASLKQFYSTPRHAATVSPFNPYNQQKTPPPSRQQVIPRHTLRAGALKRQRPQRPRPTALNTTLKVIGQIQF
jgi:hypothetical protein